MVPTKRTRRGRAVSRRKSIAPSTAADTLRPQKRASRESPRPADVSSKAAPIASLTLDYIPCNLCGANDYRVVYPNQTEYSAARDNAKDFSYSFSPESMKAGQVVKCRRCGLVYTNPRERDISAMYGGVEDDQYIKAGRERLKTFDILIKDIARHRPNKGRILDIGCAAGYFLDAARRSGWDAHGVELSKHSADEARRRGLHVVNSSLAEAGFPRGFFDVIAMNAVIEHFTDPMAELRASGAVLKEGGMIVVYTGDIDSLFARIAGRKWWYFMRMHIYFFSRRTLAMMLRKAGFKVVDVKTHTLVMSYPMMVNSAKRYPALHFFMRQLLRLRLFRNLIIPLRINGEMLIYARKVDDFPTSAASSRRRSAGSKTYI